MNHYILVKYHDAVSDQEHLKASIEALFAPATEISGIHRVSVRSACIRSANRYDLMIKMDMDQEALKAFDASDIHRQWKEEFSHLIAHKVIFDCEGE